MMSGSFSMKIWNKPGVLLCANNAMEKSAICKMLNSANQIFCIHGRAFYLKTEPTTLQQ
jgi:hypothetical protein